LELLILLSRLLLELFVSELLFTRLPLLELLVSCLLSALELALEGLVAELVGRLLRLELLVAELLIARLSVLRVVRPIGLPVELLGRLTIGRRLLEITLRGARSPVAIIEIGGRRCGPVKADVILRFLALGRLRRC
jgi:hypothetical protein